MIDLQKVPMVARLRVAVSALLVLSLLAACGSPPPQVTTTANDAINVMTDPAQRPTAKAPFSFDRGGYHWTVTPLASYEISAEVKGVELYGGDWNSTLSPVDFALAWQNLTKHSYDQHISYSQRNRWYYYEYDGGFPSDKRYIINHSANHHILPASDNVRNAALSVEAGDRIRLQGYLVNVDGRNDDNRRVWWHSSLTRSDEGDGSCEVVWVTELQKGNDIYR